MSVAATTTFTLDLNMFAEDRGLIVGIVESVISLAGRPEALAALCVLVGAAGLAVAIANLRRRDRARLGPATRLLAREAAISRRDLRLLDHLARRAGLPGAACVIVSRGCFDHAVDQCALRPGEQARLQRLREHLYARRPSR